jgi:MFS family permease
MAVEPPELLAPRPRPRGAARSIIPLLRKNRDFRLLFLAQVVSIGGDWFLFVALAGLVYSLTRSPALVAAVYASLTVPFTVFSFIGGPLADRLNRQMLMVVADLTRGVLALGFFLIHRPSQVWAVFVLSGAITALGAIFEPASMAALPNLVDAGDLTTANVMAGATWGTMLAVGSAVGGLVVAAFGRGAGYIGDAASFFVSAALVFRIRRRFSEPRERHHEHPGLFRATREAVQYARNDGRVLSMLAVKGGFGIGGGVVALLPVLAFTVFHAGDRGTGILYGFRGLGVFLGPFLVSRLAREDDLRPLFWGITASFALYGLSYAVVPWMPAIYLSGAMVMVGHFGGGGQWMLSSYALQVIVPDHVRGRIFAFDEALITLTLALSATVAGLIADVVSVKLVMMGLAGVMLLYTVVWTLATGRVRRSLRPQPEGAAA